MNNIKYKFKSIPYEHQNVALKKCWRKKEYALLMEMGTGKSKVLIDNIGILYNKGWINAVLIIAPKSMYKTWEKQEIPLHLPNYISLYTRTVIWQPNLTQKFENKLDTMFERTEDLKIFIMNVEALSTNKGLYFAEKFINLNKTLVAIDESTSIKNPNAKRTKNIMKLREIAKYRRILTGTPVTRSPLDLYSQFLFLDPGILNHSSYYSYSARYAITIKRSLGSHSFNQVIGYKNLEELSEKIQDYSYRVLKEDCLDLPNKVYTKRLIELTKEQEKLYKSIKETALAEIDGKIVSVTHVLAAMTKLQQILCGHLITNDGISEIKNKRIDELLNILDECSGKVIIWTTFRKSIFQIEKAIQDKYKNKKIVATYFGDTSTNERQNIIEKFQDPKNELRFFIGNPQTGGYGITLTQAKTVIYFNNSYDLEIRAQSEDRAHRIGQTNKVTYIDLCVEKTIDEKILLALRKKINIASEVMGEKAREWLI
jgi:SNF2 family DNA or RNA helicase